MIINKTVLFFCSTLIFLFISLYVFSKNINIENEIDYLKFIAMSKYSDVKPGKFFCPRTKLNTSSNVIALTFDACGGKNGNGYDAELINYLIKENIPATLFINGRWIKQNKELFLKLAANSLFEIENHGSAHKPGTTAGQYVYGIRGTLDPAELVEEVEINAQEIFRLTGRKPKYFRAGTAWYDETGIKIIKNMGYEVANFSNSGYDFSKKSSKFLISKRLLNSRSGDIVLLHMNHPDWNTYEAIKIAIPSLRKKGFTFVKLEETGIKNDF